MVTGVLGAALASIAELQGDPGDASEAIRVYRQALDALARDHAPDIWSGNRVGMATALSVSGWLEANPDRVREAIAIFRSAELEHAGWDLPTRTGYYYQLGKAWIRLGLLERDSASLREGIKALGRALPGTPRTYTPIFWAAIQTRLGEATLALAEQDSGGVHLAVVEQRAEALRVAVQVFRKTGHDKFASEAEKLLDRAEALLTERRERNPVE